MSGEENGLDAFIDTDQTEAPQSEDQKSEENSANFNDGLNLEDEFSKLLDSFITQNNTPSQSTKPVSNPQTIQNTSLDSFANTASNPAPSSGLDSFVTEDGNASTSSVSPIESQAGGSAPDSLDAMITPSTDSTGVGLDSMVTAAPSSGGSLDTFISEPTKPDEKNKGLKPEEAELARAMSNFQDSMIVMGSRKNLKLPKTDYTKEMLYPNYKPSVGKKIAQYLLECWDIMNKYDPENMKKLPPNANDEEYLNFTEKLTDECLQLAIISYVEILMNMEICETNYEQKRQEIIKNRIKKELYDEYMELQERKAMFITKLKEKNFPIDASRLINNYFRAAQKDAEGSFAALTKNPAMFSPIETDKLKPKFFGLIKVTPEDGIKANQKIGEFIKKLKV